MYSKVLINLLIILGLLQLGVYVFNNFRMFPTLGAVIALAYPMYLVFKFVKKADKNGKDV